MTGYTPVSEGKRKVQGARCTALGNIISTAANIHNKETAAVSGTGILYYCTTLFLIPKTQCS